MFTKEEQQAEIVATGEALVALYDRLDQLGVEHIRADWSGSGDEGQVHTIDFTRTIGEGETAEEIEVALPVELEREFQDALDNHLDARYGGWYNDTGGTGTLEVDVAKRESSIAHGWYQEDVVWEHVSDLTSTETNAKDAEKQLHDATRAASEALQRANKLEGRIYAIRLLEIAKEYNFAITGYGYEVEWNYDDEGGYFPTATIRPQYDEAKLAGDPEQGDIEFDDRWYEFGVDGLNALFDEREGHALSLVDIQAQVQKLNV